MEAQDQNPVSEQDLTSAQIVKTSLEIESLRKKNQWEPYSQFLPLATAIVACVALGFGYIEFRIGQKTQQTQFIRIQEADQRIRFQEQIRKDGDELLAFVRDEKETPVKVSFLFGLLNATVQSATKTNDESFSENYARPLTKSLVDLITESTGFEKSPRNVAFASKALDSWDDYKRYLLDNPKRLDDILFEHTRAIRYVRDTYRPFYLQTLYYNDTDKKVDLPVFENEKGEEVRFQNCVDIWESFLRHVRFAETAIREGKEMRGLELQKDIHTFEAALCNSQIATKILDDDEPGGIKRHTGVPCEIGNRSR
jgi:hypothetical protein